MTFDINETRTLLGVVERKFRPNPVLVNTFFPNAMTYPTDVIDVDYKKGGRKLAPFVVPGGKGVNIGRDGRVTRSYKAPMMRPKRILTVDDLSKRAAGEAVYSTRTPAQRAAEYRAEDLRDLEDCCLRREEYMAAQLLIKGEYDIKGYADDGKVQLVDTIAFDFTQKLNLTGTDAWTAADTADAYGQLSEAAKNIRRNAGLVPNVMFMSDATAQLLLKNKSVRDHMMIPSRDNLALMSIQPQVESLEVPRFGRIGALNLDAYVYDGIYQDEETDLPVQFLPDGYVVIGVSGRGRRLYGAITQLEKDQKYYSYEGRYVPKVTVDYESDTSAVIMSSRCLVVPESVDDWFVLKVTE